MYKAFISALLGLVVAAPALAQNSRTVDPNMRNWYMARQQVQIIDDSPVVTRSGGDGGGGQQGGGKNGGGVGSLDRPQGLPKAGWQPYSQSVPQLQTSLPKVVNGVPPAPVPQKPMKVNSGKLKQARKPAGGSVAPSQPTVASYGENAYTRSGSPSPATAVQGTQSQVRGSVLHWARKKGNY